MCTCFKNSYQLSDLEDLREMCNKYVVKKALVYKDLRSFLYSILNQ
jgi:hypothetical protein